MIIATNRWRLATSAHCMRREHATIVDTKRTAAPRRPDRPAQRECHRGRRGRAGAKGLGTCLVMGRVYASSRILPSSQPRINKAPLTGSPSQNHRPADDEERQASRCYERRGFGDLRPTVSASARRNGSSQTRRYRRSGSSAHRLPSPGTSRRSPAQIGTTGVSRTGIFARTDSSM
jgi:hypothetical protein